MNRLCTINLIVAACLLLPLAAQAKTLTLADAEGKAVATSFEMRAQHFEERSKEWEKRNAVANYLPTVNYGFDYTQMDEDIVNAANAGLDGFSDMGQLPYFIGLLGMQDSAIIDPLSGANVRSIYDTLYFKALEAAQSEAEDPFKASRMYRTTLKHSITVSQPLTNGGVEIIAIGIAKDTKAAIELGREAQRQQVVYNTRKAYFDALAAGERTIVANQELSWTRQNLEKARMRQQAGAVPMTDLLQWEAEEAQKQSNVFTAEATERFMLLSLYQAMGVQVHAADTTIRLQPLETFEKWYAGSRQLARGDVENNPQLKSVALMTNVAARNKQIAVAQFMPKVNTFFSYSWPQYINQDHELELNEPQKGWTAGVTASVPIFSGMRNSTNYKKSNYAYMKAEVERQKLFNQFSVNLKRIRLFHKAAWEGVAAAQKQQELMEKNLAIMQKRYDGGLVNQSQLLEVSLGARMAKIGYIQKLFECLMLESEYLLTIGKLEATQ